MAKPTKAKSKPKGGKPAKPKGGKPAKPKAEKQAKPKVKKAGAKRQPAAPAVAPPPVAPPLAIGPSPAVLDRLWSVVMSRRGADPSVSHSARLLARGTAKIAQKFGEEAVECLIEATMNNRAALVAESADVLYHLIVMWVDAGLHPDEIWTELQRREGVSGIAEKASRLDPLVLPLGTKKIP